MAKVREPRQSARARRNSQLKEEYPIPREIAVNTSLAASDVLVVADTATGAISIEMDSGQDGKSVKVYNVGIAANDVTVTGKGTDTVANPTLADGENYEYTYVDGTWL